ncbi:hypothetical protein AQ490_20250 [Wenjunlia vitaminophila]|uniref:Uncharacterized protein n=1 Tax=Wenjunlia vitaminophila TaxID=76728 RepID=A0A0T6LVB6_WENVI|nr:hypothetical protein [Wenjunlia vitaminophila]KRV49647.1 hypothetical protein AQ490_20250 [Wenjunlia vitaminophila]
MLVVGGDVHTFDAAIPYPAPIPAMRPSCEAFDRSGTPIYDALYSEYRRLFRALPGDRTGEEELRFTGFQQDHAARQQWGTECPTVRQAGPYCGGQRALPPGGHHGNRPDDR